MLADIEVAAGGSPNSLEDPNLKREVRPPFRPFLLSDKSVFEVGEVRFVLLSRSRWETQRERGSKLP